VGPFNAREGNPGLRPQQTDSFEAGYQYRAGGTFYLGTLYYRHNENGVTDIAREIDNGVVLTSKANLAQSQSAGLELVANGHLTKTLSYNASTNFYWNQIDASGVPLGPGLGFGSTRSAFAVGGRASVNWQATPKDLFQINVQENAKRLLPQGFAAPMTLVFLGYRHKFTDSLSAVVTVQDPTNSYRYRQTIQSPLLNEHIESRGRIQAAYLGFTWNFGAVKQRPRDQGFDFGNGQPQS
jgi:outer membrane receptor protein involved in Fe transport